MNQHAYFLGYIGKQSAEKIVGGYADGMDNTDLAKKHKAPQDFIDNQVEEGVSVEHEHTDDAAEAEEIAQDHVEEIPDYYTRLHNMEEQAKDELDEESGTG
jgi:hypothetical protein